jgi:hypothetical protein
METNPCKALGCRACCVNIEGHSAISDSRFKKVYPEAQYVETIESLNDCKNKTNGVYYTMYRSWVYFIVNGVCPRQNGTGCDVHNSSYYLPHCINMEYSSPECNASKS